MERSIIGYVNVNGTVVTSFTVTAADATAATGNYSTYNGDNVEFYFNSGTWDTEITFQITAPDGSSIGSYGPYLTNSGNDQSIWTGVSNSTCSFNPNCIDPTALTASKLLQVLIFHGLVVQMLLLIMLNMVFSIHSR